MTAIFKDDIGTFMVEKVVDMVYDAENKVWNIMFENYEERKYKAELIRINNEV